jgi:hypothetical protein
MSLTILMNLTFSNFSKIDYVKLFPVKNNRVLFLKRLIFDRGVENIVNIMLSVICRIHSADQVRIKPLRELFLGNYPESHFKEKTGIILNEAIVLPQECEMIEFNFISQVPFDLHLDYDLK